MLLVPEGRFPLHEIERYVKRNKSDAEAICEAATRPNMRFVPIRTPEQQSVLKLHRTRQMFVRQRTTLINAIWAHLAELGIVAGVGRNGVEILSGRSLMDDMCPLMAHLRLDRAHGLTTGAEG